MATYGRCGHGGPSIRNLNPMLSGTKTAVFHLSPEAGWSAPAFPICSFAVRMGRLAAVVPESLPVASNQPDSCRAVNSAIAWLLAVLAGGRRRLLSNRALALLARKRTHLTFTPSISGEGQDSGFQDRSKCNGFPPKCKGITREFSKSLTLPTFNPVFRPAADVFGGDQFRPGCSPGRRATCRWPFPFYSG